MTVKVIPLCFLFFACTSSVAKKPLTLELKDDKHGTAANWYRGQPSDGIVQANKLNKPIFLFWGTVWSPPSNEVKAEIFLNPGFASLMKDVVPIYLDGDQAGAQILGEEFRISTYPSMLLLGPDKKEWIRFSESLTFEQFEKAISLTLAAEQPVESSLDLIISGSGKIGDFERLAYSTQNTEEEREWLAPDRLIQLRKACDLTPSNREDIRGLLIAKFLSLLAKANENGYDGIADVVARAKADRATLLSNLLDSTAGADASHEFLFFEAESATKLLFRNGETSLRDRWLGTWQTSIRRVRKQRSKDLNIHLRSFYGEISVARLRSGKSHALSKNMRYEVISSVRQADQAAKSAFQRLAIIPAAAIILQQVGEAAKARDLLTSEIGRSIAPWYIYTSLASLEEQLGNFNAAKKYSHLATDSARGQATRLQWRVNDILLTARHMSAEDEPYLVDEINGLYEELFELNDGFWGRNRYRLSALEQNFASLASTAIITLVNAQRGNCSEFKGEGAKRCTKHFDSMQLSIK